MTRRREPARRAGKTARSAVRPRPEQQETGGKPFGHPRSSPAFLLEGRAALQHTEPRAPDVLAEFYDEELVEWGETLLRLVRGARLVLEMQKRTLRFRQTPPPSGVTEQQRIAWQILEQLCAHVPSDPLNSPQAHEAKATFDGVLKKLSIAGIENSRKAALDSFTRYYRRANDGDAGARKTLGDVVKALVDFNESCRKQYRYNEETWCCWCIREAYRRAVIDLSYIRDEKTKNAQREVDGRKLVTVPTESEALGRLRERLTQIVSCFPRLLREEHIEDLLDEAGHLVAVHRRSAGKAEESSRIALGAALGVHHNTIYNHTKDAQLDMGDALGAYSTGVFYRGTLPPALVGTDRADANRTPTDPTVLQLRKWRRWITGVGEDGATFTGLREQHETVLNDHEVFRVFDQTVRENADWIDGHHGRAFILCARRAYIGRIAQGTALYIDMTKNSMSLLRIMKEMAEVASKLTADFYGAQFPASEKVAVTFRLVAGMAEVVPVEAIEADIAQLEKQTALAAMHAKEALINLGVPTAEHARLLKDLDAVIVTVDRLARKYFGFVLGREFPPMQTTLASGWEEVFRSPLVRPEV